MCMHACVHVYVCIHACACVYILVLHCGRGTYCMYVSGILCDRLEYCLYTVYTYTHLLHSCVHVNRERVQVEEIHNIQEDKSLLGDRQRQDQAAKGQED